MQIIKFLLVGLLITNSLAVHAQSTGPPVTTGGSASPFHSRTAIEHMTEAKSYEEKARLLQAEARGMEAAVWEILPYMKMETVQKAGIHHLIDRRMKQAGEMKTMAIWHRKEAMRKIAERQASEDR